MKIIGYTVGTSLPKPNFDQNDPKKGDYIRGDRSFLKSVKIIEQELTESEQAQARVNIDIDYATDEEIIAMMLAEGIIVDVVEPIVLYVDANGNATLENATFIVDENNNSTTNARLIVNENGNAVIENEV